MGFGVAIYLVNTQSSDGLHPARRPGDDLRDHPDASRLDPRVHQRQVPRAAEDRQDNRGVNSVSSLAGYEVLTEGRGSNAGTCLINLKPWADRKLTSRQIIERARRKGRAIANVKLEFFEPPAVPGFGAAGGFSTRVLDKTNTNDYQRLGEVTTKFMAALSKRKEVKRPVHLLRQQLPAV